MKNFDTMLVGFDHSHGDPAVLIVGRKAPGDMTLELEPGQKLEMITWKEDSLWYLTRPMRDDEEPETHTFQQSSEFGVFEGTVTIVESVVEGENAS